MKHECMESRYLENKAEQINKAESWHGDSLLAHCCDVRETFDRLFEFYDFKNHVLLELGHYLSYYHDIGKLEGRPGGGHSLISVKLLDRDGVCLNSCKRLTPLAWYFISRHHSSLTLPAKVDWGDLEDMKRLNWERYVNYLRGEFDPVDLADVFGLFKLADALSSYKAKAGQVPPYDAKPIIHADMVKDMLGACVDEARWRYQLKLCELPRIAMLRAPTGWGKTTSSLLFASTRSPTRVFYLLPTITAIKQFFSRLDRVFPNVSMYFHLYDAEVKDEGEERLQQIFFIKSFLNPFVVTTVDQFLLAFLQLGKYFTRRLSFRGASIILDEIHLLSPQTLYLLTYFVDKFRDRYGMSMLIMSATLPEAYIQYLQKRLRLSDSILDLRDEYSRKRRVLFHARDYDLSSALHEIYGDYSAGRKVLVVVNTVEKAVETARSLRKILQENGRPPDDVLLIHGRFMYVDRRSVEGAVELAQERPHILVSTQVCEVSLDVSYDRLYTEAAPLGSIVQRFGRVNRYGTKTDMVNAFIHYPNELRDQDKASRYPYEEDEVRVCWGVLRELEGCKLENELQLLDKFDSEFDVKNLESFTSKFNMDVWDEVLLDLFSLPLDEEKVKELLEYRENFTLLSLVNPEDVTDDGRRDELLQAIEQAKKGASYEERLRAAATLKDLAVPVPFWYLRKVQETIYGLPLIKLRKGEYSVEYGLH